MNDKMMNQFILRKKFKKIDFNCYLNVHLFANHGAKIMPAMITAKSNKNKFDINIK